jgi:hypothetical protein
MRLVVIVAARLVVSIHDGGIAAIARSIIVNPMATHLAHRNRRSRSRGIGSCCVPDQTLVLEVACDAFEFGHGFSFCCLALS